MPVVPFNPAPTVAPSDSAGITPYQQTSATPDTFGAGVGREQQRLGGEVEQFGRVLQHHANVLQDRANQSAAKDLFLAADEELGNLDIGYRQLTGAAATSAYPKYQQDVASLREKWKAKAGNVDVARLFDNDFSRRASYNIIDAAKFAAGQNRQYNLRTSEAMVSNAVSDAAKAAEDDGRFQENIKLIEAQVDSQAGLLGWSPELTKSEKDGKVSAAWAARIEALAMRNPFEAKKVYDKAKDGIDGPTQMAIERKLAQQEVSVGTRIRTDQITAGVVPNVTRVNAAKPNEFWGDPDAPGFSSKHLTMVKTKGEKTVVVNKQAAAAFEGFLNELEDRGYPIESVGGAVNRNIAGTGTKSQHAYGNAIDINPGKNPVMFGRVVTDLPRDISVIAAKYGLSWGGDWKGIKKDAMHFEWSGEKTAPLTGTSDAKWLSAALEQAKAVARKDAPDNPTYEDMLINRVTAEYNRVRGLRREEDRGNFNTVFSAVIGADGGQPAKSMDVIFNDAATNQAYNALDPKRQEQVQNAVKRNAAADVPLTPEKYSRFQEVMGLSVTDPQVFLDTDPAAEGLPRALTSQIFSKQHSMQGKLEDTTRLNGALRTVQPMLADAGIVPSRTEKAKAATYNQFVGAFNQRLSDFVDQNKKFPTEEEQMKIAADLVLKKVPGQPFTVLGMPLWSTDRRDFEIPADFSEKYGRQFKDRYGRAPTAQEMYLMHRRANAQ